MRNFTLKINYKFFKNYYYFFVCHKQALSISSISNWKINAISLVMQLANQSIGSFAESKCKTWALTEHIQSQTSLIQLLDVIQTKFMNSHLFNYRYNDKREETRMSKRYDFTIFAFKHLQFAVITTTNNDENCTRSPVRRFWMELFYFLNIIDVHIDSLYGCSLFVNTWNRAIISPLIIHHHFILFSLFSYILCMN